MCSEGGQDPQGQKAPKCFKTGAFSAKFCPSEGVSSVARQDEESEKHRLENTVGNLLDLGPEKTMTARDVTGFYAFSP